MQPIFSRSFFLTPGLCNARRELPVPQLVSQIIETATEHANLLGIGFKKMTPMRIGWVLSRLTLEMQRYPKFNEHYTVTTWVESWNRHFSVRDFAVTDGEGREIGYARSIWMVIDLESHENVGTGALECPPEIVTTTLSCPIARQAKHPVFEPDRTADYTFRYTDIDFYRHVNTVRYVELLLNQFPLDRYDHYYVGRLEMAFQREARFGEQVQIGILTSPSQRESHSSEKDPTAQSPSSSQCESEILENMEIKRGSDAILNARIFFRHS